MSDKVPCEMIGGPLDGRTIALDNTSPAIIFPYRSPAGGFGKIRYRRASDTSYEYVGYGSQGTYATPEDEARLEIIPERERWEEMRRQRERDIEEAGKTLYAI